MNAPAKPLEHLLHTLPDLDWVTEEARVARLSQDFSWFSPVLKRQLAGKTAEAAVRPRTEEEIVRIVAACARHQAPRTASPSPSGGRAPATTARPCRCTVAWCWT